MSVPNAVARAGKLGITLDTSQQSPVPGVPANTVASQDIAAGTKLVNNAVVRAVVSSGVQLVPAAQSAAPAGVTTVTVPGVVGAPYQQAINVIGGAGFVAGVRYQIQSTNTGTILSQDPAGESQAAQGSTVTVTVAVPGAIPDTEGMSVEAARSVLLANGYPVGRHGVHQQSRRRRARRRNGSGGWDAAAAGLFGHAHREWPRAAIA